MNITKKLLDLKAQYRKAYPQANFSFLKHVAHVNLSPNGLERLLADHRLSGMRIHPTDYTYSCNLDHGWDYKLFEVHYADGVVLDFDTANDKITINKKCFDQYGNLMITNQWFTI